MALDGGTAVWRATAVIALAVAFASTGCGDSDDGKSATASGDRSASSGDITYEATLEGDDREQIATTMAYLRERFNASDGAAFCDKLTASGLAETRNAGRAFDAGSACPEVISTISSDARRVTPSGQRPVRISKIVVTGDRAVVTSRGGLIGTRLAPLRLRKEGDEWKLVEVAAKKKTSLLPDGAGAK